MDEITTLHQVPLFSRMDDEEVVGIREIMEVDTFAPGQVIIQAGEQGDLFYVVIGGKVQFSVQDASGKEIVVDEVGPGGFFGELSMLTGEPRSARVKAINQVTTLALERAEFFEFLQKHPHAAIDVLTVIGQRLHRTDKLLTLSVSKNVNEIVDQQLTVGQRIADAIADFSGSMPFLFGNATIFIVWLLWNQPWSPLPSFDPAPYGLLTMIVSLEAIFLSIFVLISQNRQSAIDRIAADIDHKVNAKAELEIGLVMQRLDDLQQSLHHQHREHVALLRMIDTRNGDGKEPQQ